MSKQEKNVHVFIVGSKGIPAQYGGFETFVENLTARKRNPNIKYYVSCMNNDERSFEYNDAKCINIKLPCKGAIGRILHVARVLRYIEKWKKRNIDEETIVYILGCRIGPLLIPHSKILHKLGVKIWVNPDGLEWRRDKWNSIEKIILNYCEKCLVLNANLIICDSINIEKYILKSYPCMVGKTIYIAYGADITVSSFSDSGFDKWLKNNDLCKSNYYLIVGRFVPENNYETMIAEFMKSNTNKPLVIVSNVEKNGFYDNLKNRTKFEEDERIKFIGTVYEQELLKKIRENAYAYIHGHEVGGTNPSLLEALASTKINLLLDVGFNREVGDKSAFYWDKTENSLKELINNVEILDTKIIEEYGCSARNRIYELFRWEKIVSEYEALINRWSN